jgi:hypothetical protein
MPDPRAPFRAYNRTVGKSPLLDAGVRGAAGAAAGYYGATALHKLLTGISTDKVSDEDLAKLSPAERQKALQRNAVIDKWEKSGRIDKIKRMYALAGGGLAASTPLIQSISSHHGVKDNLSKLINKEKFFDDNPEAAQLEISEAKDKDAIPFTAGSGGFEAGRTRHAGRNLYKTSALQTFFSQNVPVHQARQMIQRDPFLTLGEKTTVDGIIGGTPEGDSGMTSGASIASTALKAGVGAVGGFALGKTLGNLFALESEHIDRLSQYGGVAGAIYNTGILNRSL